MNHRIVECLGLEGVLSAAREFCLFAADEGNGIYCKPMPLRRGVKLSYAVVSGDCFNHL